jgi:hypothetical protein
MTAPVKHGSRTPLAGVLLALGAGLGAAVGVVFGADGLVWGVVIGAAVGNAVGAVVDWRRGRPPQSANTTRKERLS